MRTVQQQMAAYNGMTPAEIAKALNCDRGHVLNLIRDGVLPAINIARGGRPEYRVNRPDFEAFLERRQVGKST